MRENVPPVWGTTCPCLRIARHFDVDYEWPLAVVDNLLRGRHPNTHKSAAEWEALKARPDFNDFLDACISTARHTWHLWNTK